MAGKDNCTTAAHGGTLFGSETANPVEMLAVCSDRSRYSRTQQIHSRALQVGRRVSGCRVSGRNSLRTQTLSGLHRAKSGGISSEKKAF